ncbi:MAG: Holliday junction branch migration DNA helicase RuvB [Candidatus Spechtbacterales bacterium]|nr:Holliday junction branch migration DNA helicase RuvB [Candidatus Spechtbacterales bacterium]
MNKTSGKQKSEDRLLDSTLRPAVWEEYVGQEKAKEKLRIFIDATKKRNEALDHTLLYGPPGLGKTTLAHLIAKELGVNIKITSGPAIEKVGDIASILTNLSPYDVLFIDEVHRLNKNIEEVLYPAMEQSTLDIILGKGPSARTIQLELPPFTLISATTRAGLISAPLRSRFGITARLNFYENNELKQILERSSDILGTKIDSAALEEVAKRSRKTPRVANRLLKRVRDYAEVKHKGKITEKAANEGLEMLEVDHMGLEPTDKKILEIIINKFNGGPVGVQTLAAGAFEEADTIEEVYEPYLMQIGFIERTPRGRMATPAAYEHLGLEVPRNNRLI